MLRPHFECGILVLPHQHARGDLEVAFAAHHFLGRSDWTFNLFFWECAGDGAGEERCVAPKVQARSGAWVAFDGDYSVVGFDEVEGDLCWVSHANSIAKHADLHTCPLKLGTSDTKSWIYAYIPA